MQQSAISSNGLASQPSRSRPPRAQHEGEERLQIRGNSKLINSILVAGVLGRGQTGKPQQPPASPRFSFPGFSRHLIWIANTPRAWILEQHPTGQHSRAPRCSLRLFGSVAAIRPMRYPPRVKSLLPEGGFPSACPSFPAFSHAQRIMQTARWKRKFPPSTLREDESSLLLRVWHAARSPSYRDTLRYQAPHCSTVKPLESESRVTQLGGRPSTSRSVSCLSIGPRRYQLERSLLASRDRAVHPDVLGAPWPTKSGGCFECATACSSRLVRASSTRLQGRTRWGWLVRQRAFLSAKLDSHHVCRQLYADTILDIAHLPSHSDVDG
ncbi:hypothetical protein B0T14DRAFT_114373 [Immersiella caudata]|uniref:Uncharacterized protein n=1 Tax=Immersiella caudata TaxID=314043 RepID=A0AA39X3P2_9PEZI|nr:hypothetical protein B0T14DRAFT_114373 [Immersiella caudata]